MASRLRRTLPFLQALAKIERSNKRLDTLKTFPDFVLHDIIELLFNIVHNKCHISCKHKHVLVRNRKNIENFLNSAKSRRKRPKSILGQRGGFIGTLIPILLSVLNSIL